MLRVWITIECGLTLKLARIVIKTYSQMHRTDKYAQHISIIWPVWLNGRVFVYELSGCGFESRCCHLNFRCGTCFEQGVPWHSGKLQSVDSLWNWQIHKTNERWSLVYQIFEISLQLAIPFMFLKLLTFFGTTFSSRV